MKLLIPIILLVAVVAYGSIYTLRPTEQAVVTRFGEIVGEPVTDAGLHFKAPFIDAINRLPKRVLEWSGGTRQATPTQDKLYILVETFARWRIVDPKLFFVSLTDERRAQSRLDGILGSQTRSAIAAHDLVEIVRTDKDRKVVLDSSSDRDAEDLPVLPQIRFGRAKLEREVLEKSKATLLSEFGIELLDVRFKRVNYDDSVLPDIFGRMISERTKIAEKFRSEGQGLASEINGSRERELKTVRSDADRQSQEIRGKADAEASQIYAQAYNSSPQAVEFYGFLKTLESYETSIDANSTLVISSKSEFLRYLDGTQPMEPQAFPAPKAPAPPNEKDAAPPKPPAPARAVTTPPVVEKAPSVPALVPAKTPESAALPN